MSLRAARPLRPAFLTSVWYFPRVPHVAIVTGAGGGIGSAYARGLAESGVSVALADVRVDAAAAVAEALTGAGLEAIAVALDVTSEAQWSDAVATVDARFGPVDILVNNAAVRPKRDLAEVTPELWDEVFAVNVRGPFFLANPRGFAVGQLLDDLFGGLGHAHISLSRWETLSASPGRRSTAGGAEAYASS